MSVQSYRRGVVLGLSVAEVMILLLFAFLLVMQFLVDRNEEAMAALNLDVDLQALLEGNPGAVDVLINLSPTEIDWLVEHPEIVAAMVQNEGIDLAVVDSLFDNLQDAQRFVVYVEENGEKSTGELLEVLENTSIREAINALRSVGGNDRPPIIVLEDDQFRFRSGSAEMSAEFEQRLRSNVVAEMRRLIEEYRIDVVEVIGHTDEVPVSRAQRTSSNLDTELLDFLSARTNQTPRASDNAGLGMSRASAVARLFEDAGLGELVEIIPLSAGANVTREDTLSSGLDGGDDASRRRIEIRLRRHPEDYIAEE